MNTAQKIAAELLRVKAVKISVDPPFTWASGIKSPIYCDNRILIALPDVRELIVSAFCEQVSLLKPDYIAGTATAGIPWAAFVAERMKLPMVYVRPEPKGHGAGKQVEGLLPPGQQVLLIEDLVSTGGSSMKAVQALRTEGNAKVTDILAIVTYEMAAAKKTCSEGEINLTALTTFTDLLAQLREERSLEAEKIAMVLEFSKDPPNWWENFQK